MSRRRRDGGLPVWLVLAATVVLLAVVVCNLPSLRPAPPTPPTSDWYQVYFTEPGTPDRPGARRGGIDERFVEFVDAATRSLDVAVYDFDLENVAQALTRARSRGVTVRMVLDSDTIANTRDENIRRALDVLSQGGVPLVGDERAGIMHHKFAVRDGEEVWTGSWNMTTGDTYRLNNNATRLRSPELAAQYTVEFEEMFVQRRFGPSKPRGGPSAPIPIGSGQVEALFSPGENVAARIAERVSEAQTSANFMAFSFTHDVIGRAVVERAQAGVAVAGVFESTGSLTRFSEFGQMSEAGLAVYRDGNPYLMHHKVFILDGRAVIFGSFNFSQSADRENDENCLIVEDAAFAEGFAREFDQILEAAKVSTGARQGPERDRPR